MSIAAGWYADPVQPGALRWWNGTGWTDAVQHPAAVGVPAAYGYPGYAPVHQPVYDVAARQEFAPIHLLLPQAQSAATRSLVWGIVAVLLFVAFPAAIVAIAFGGIGLARAAKLQSRGAAPSGRGRAIAGIVLGSLSLLLLVSTVVLVAVVR